MIGYAQLIPPRTFRKIIAKSELHRGWLAGNQGNIGEPEGVLYRRWHTNRKQHPNATFKQAWQSLRNYYGLYNSKKSRFLIVAICKDILEV
jgi:hypothetical protein